MYFFDFFVLLVGVLLGLAFFTLLEQKVLGYAHFRKGPTKLFYFGVLQPISDVVKLFCKEFLKGYKLLNYYYFFGPALGVFYVLSLSVGGKFVGCMW